MKITVVGAGAFGSWSAYYLQSAGHKVTLVDCYGPGNYKASSGGESRMLRGIYGNNHQYIQWTNRSLELWKAFQKQWGEKLYVLSLIHISSPRDRTRSRMPSSA